MSGSKYVKVFRTVLITGGAFLLNYLIQLVLTPYITENIGAEAHGFVTLAKNFAQYAAIITAAVNSFASRYIAVAYHKDNKKEARMYFSSVFYGDVVLASVLFLLAAFLIMTLENILKIPQGMTDDVKRLFFLVFANFWIVTVFTVYESSAYVKNKLDVTGAFKGLSYFTEAVVLCGLFLTLRPKMHYIGFGMVAASVVTVLGNRWICRKHTPDLIVRKSDFSLAAVKKLVVDGIWTSVNSLGEILNNGLDLLVCNLLLTPLSMGQVSIAKTVHTMFYGLFVIINPAFQPMFLKSYAEKKMDTLLGELKLAMKVSGMLANLAFAGFFALGISFLQLWIPNQDVRLIYELTVINCLTLIPGGPMQPLYYIYTLTVKKKIPCLVTIAGGLFNVAGMYLLIRYTSLGSYSVVLTTAAVMMVINFVTNPLYMAHVLDLPWHTFYPEIIRNTLACGILVLVFSGLKTLYLPVGWVPFVINAGIYVILGAALHLLVVMNKKDWKLLMGFFRIRRQGKW